MKKLTLLIALLAVIGTVEAQSITQPLARPHFNPNATELGADTLIPGTNFKGIRLQGAGALYAVALKPFSVSSSAVAVVYGIGWENDVWDNASQRFYQKIGISLLGGPGGAVGVGLVGIVALTVSTQMVFNAKLPFRVVVGIAYNTATSQLQAVTGPVNGLIN